MIQLMLNEATERPVSINPHYIEALQPNYPPKIGTLIQMSSGRYYAVTEEYNKLTQLVTELQQ